MLLLRWRNSAKLVASILLFYFGVGLSADLAAGLSPQSSDSSDSSASGSRDSSSSDNPQGLSEGWLAFVGWGVVFTNAFGVWVSYNLLKGAALLNMEGM